jgi:hypothetical protein
MTRDLVYRMRTCAAAILAGHGSDLLRQDTANVLVEASNLLEEPEDLGLPMDVIKAVEPHREEAPQGAHWGGGDLPTRTFDFGAVNPKPCPSCGAIDVRKVKIERNKLVLICPRCSHHWEYAK